jgi:Sulfotransferase family
MKPPVFVLGSPRSGTTLLYHMLLSSGGFAVYRTESNVFNLLVPRFGDLSLRKHKKALMKVWLQSKLFRVSGLDAQDIEAKILAECKSGADFLTIVMEEIARSQNVERWAECTPEHILYLPQIMKGLADALVIHIIRDGRDVALSLDKLGWIRPFPWQRDRSRLVAGLFWEWIVGRGRDYGRIVGHNYTEVRFEELVAYPRETLAKLSEFIHHDLDYDRIQRIAIGSVRKPNTSFEAESHGEAFKPVGRWKHGFSPGELAKLEVMIGKFLEELHYPLSTSGEASGNSAELTRMRTLYRMYFDSRLWLKKNTVLSRYLIDTDLSWL